MLPLASKFGAPVETRFLVEERGAVTMIFAIVLMVLMLFLSCAIDIGRSLAAKTKLTSAVDAATIFAAKQLKAGSMTTAALEAMARTFFDQNMATGSKSAVITDFKLSPTGDGKGVTIDVKSELPTTFARVAGINKIDVPVTATAIFNQQDIEVGLQLDVTGSMNTPINGVRKIDSLKLSTTNLLDILLPDGGTGTTKVRVGIAPFSAGVNAGAYAKAVAGVAVPGGCVYERRTAFNDASDAAPTGADSLKTLADLVKPNAVAPPCPATSVVAALTDDKASLKPVVAALSAGGWTSGHLGTTWAWGLISPQWSGVWPAASKPADYTDKNTVKIAILMTDGIYNTVGGNNDGTEFGGAYGVDSRNRAKALCDGMKNKGIQIYTVGFIMVGDNPAAADTLKYCASSVANFYKAEDGAQLDAAFRNIAQDISRLRLSK